MRTGETLAAIRGKTDLAISGTGICGEPKTGTDGVTPKADASNCKPQANRISGGLGWVTRGLERVKKSTQASQPLLLLIGS